MTCGTASRRNSAPCCTNAAQAKQLAALGFRRLSVRPQPPKSDAAAQEAFEKTTPKRVPQRSRRGRGTSRWRSGSKGEPDQKTIRGTVSPANGGPENHLGDGFPGDRARGSARNPDPHPGPARHQTPRAPRHPLSMGVRPLTRTGGARGLTVRCRLPGARCCSRAGPAHRQHRGDERPPRRDLAHHRTRSSGK